MKIPGQFEDIFSGTALVIVSGAQTGTVYLVQKGFLEAIFKPEVSLPSYSDKEGQFMKGGRGMTFERGSVREENKQEHYSRYVSMLVAGITNAAQEIQVTELYLAAPDYLILMIQKALPPKLQAMVRCTISGNLVERHPTEILERIKEEIDRTQAE